MKKMKTINQFKIIKAKLSSVFAFYLCSFLIFNFSLIIGTAQDIHFSQFYFSPLEVNPANAGGERKEMRAVLNYKDQWRSISAPYQTLAASYDMKFGKTKRTAGGYWGGGINIFNDKAGDIKMNSLQVNLSAAYHVFLNRRRQSTLGGGLQTGFVQRSMSYDNVTWGNQWDGSSYNPNLPTGEPKAGETTFSMMDYLRAGILWHYSNLAGRLKVTADQQLEATAGLSVHHAVRPEYSFYDSGEKLNRKYVLHGNALIGIKNTNIAFAPSFIYQRQGPAQEIFPGTLIRYRFQQASKYTGYYKGTYLSFGGFFRVKDAVVAAMVIEHSEYSLGISYDFNISDLRAATSGRGGFEISLRYQSVTSALYGGRSKF